MKAFLLIERHSIRWYGEKGEKFDIKGVICTVVAESIDKVPESTGGEYDVIPFDEGQRPVIRLDRKLFAPHSEKILKYEKGPIHLYIGEDNAGTYLFILEVPLLQPSKLKILIKTPDQVDFDEYEKRMPKVQDTTVVIFPSFRLAVHMASCFVHKDLIPRVGGKEEAVKFPLIKTGPSRPADEMMDEIVLGKPTNNKETWLLIGNSRFQEFYDYLSNKYPGENPAVEIQDLR